uniref:NADH dehydrogenase ubiquinone iron-sulfur protein 6 n=1 Tax=Rhizophora mucronata TaxID=61149 RepID=A0A2P2KAP7_RHIMU
MPKGRVSVYNKKWQMNISQLVPNGLLCTCFLFYSHNYFASAEQAIYFN